MITSPSRTLLALSLAFSSATAVAAAPPICRGAIKNTRQTRAAAAAPATQWARELLLQLRGQLAALEGQSDYLERARSGPLDPVNVFDARRGLPRLGQPAGSQEVIEIGEFLNDPDRPVSYGLRAGAGEQPLASSSRFAMLSRLEGLVTRLDDASAFSGRRSYGKRYSGKDELKQFLTELAAEVESIAQAPAPVDDSDSYEDEERTSAQITIMGYEVPDRIGGVLVPKFYLAELFGIWVFPGPIGAELLEASIHPYVSAISRWTFGSEIGCAAQAAVTGLATLYAVLRGIRLGWYRPGETNARPASCSAAPGSAAIEASPEPPALNPVPVHTQFMSYLRAIREVAEGKRVLRRNELWYFGSSFLGRPNRDTGERTPRRFDLILANPRGVPELVVVGESRLTRL